ncbi:MAG: hypothetical protein ABII09_11005 [Planctomycetota bacterium]
MDEHSKIEERLAELEGKLTNEINETKRGIEIVGVMMVAMGFSYLFTSSLKLVAIMPIGTAVMFYLEDLIKRKRSQ